MSLLRIAWRSLVERRLSSFLTGLSIALGAALVVAVLVIFSVIERSFSQAAHGYSIIVGAKGGRTELVLNTVFHLGRPIENIPWSFYKEFSEGRFSRAVKVAIPYCLGDNYKGYRVVGTTPELFSELEYAPGRKYEFHDGRNFATDGFYEGVVGYLVARRTGLKVGDTFAPTHGITTEEGQGHTHDEFRVVGILAPTGTPNDRALFVNMEGFFLLEGHAKGSPQPQGPDGSEAEESDEAETRAESNDGQAGSAGVSNESNAAVGDHQNETSAADAHSGHQGHTHNREPLPEDQREVTCVLVRVTDPILGTHLPNVINEGPVAQAVSPLRVTQELINTIFQPIRWLLLVLTTLVIIVAGVGMMVAIYNTMSERRREIAVMRALGASRRTILMIVLCESVMLAVLGGAAGVLLGHGLIRVANPFVVAMTGVSIGLLEFDILEGLLIPGLVILAAVVGYLPAMSAYRTDVARVLSAAP